MIGLKRNDAAMHLSIYKYRSLMNQVQNAVLCFCLRVPSFSDHHLPLQPRDNHVFFGSRHGTSLVTVSTRLPDLFTIDSGSTVTLTFVCVF